MSDTGTQRFRRGNGDGMCAHGESTQHGKPMMVIPMLPRLSRRRPGGDATDDGPAALDDQRREDSHLSDTAGVIRLSGVYLWPMLFNEDGASLSGHASFGEEDQATLRYYS